MKTSTLNRATGARVRAARRAAGLSQYELADRLGCKQTGITMVETGARHASLEWLWTAAEAIGCDPAELDKRLAPRKGCDS